MSAFSNLSFDFMTVLLLASAVHGLFLAVALLTIRRGVRRANALLAALLVIFAALLARHALWGAALSMTFVMTPAFLLAPLFYFYGNARTQRSFALTMKDALHLLPFAVAVAATLAEHGLNAQGVWSSATPAQCRHCRIALWALLAHMLIYGALTFAHLRRYEANLRDTFAAIEKLSLHWLQQLLAVYVIDWCLLLAWQATGGATAMAHVLWLIVALLIYMIGYKALQQPEFFLQAEAAATDAKKKYEKSTLAPERAEAAYDELLQLMTEQKPFLQHDLSLPKLAQRSALSTHHLSQIINSRRQQNFFEFVNQYRVAEAQRLLLEPSKAPLNLSAIAFEAGFSSVSAFNAAFKKYTGMTPSQFRRKHSGALSANLSPSSLPIK